MSQAADLTDAVISILLPKSTRSGTARPRGRYRLWRLARARSNGPRCP